MLEPVPAQVDFILGHRIKHERVIRIWGMTQGKDVGVIVHHLFLSPHRLDRIRLFGEIKLWDVSQSKSGEILEGGAPATPNECPSARAWAELAELAPPFHKNKTAAAISRGGCLELSINVR
jgi:hypothetical protein